jgi:DNA-binding NtrC family response regulator
MPTTVVLAVCLDSLVPGIQDSAWRSAGYFFIPAISIREAISHLKAGDFDMVLLGQSIPEDDKERLAFLIRATGSKVPVVCIAGSSPHHDSFVDATFGTDQGEMLAGLEGLMASKSRERTVPAFQFANAT